MQGIVRKIALGLGAISVSFTCLTSASPLYHLTPLPLTSSDQTALAINENGQIVGKQFLYGFFYNAGVVTTLPTLGGTSSVADALNSNGDIVGNADTNTRRSTFGPYIYHAFHYKNGVMTDLGTLVTDPSFGGSYSSATAVNNAGQIVGWADANDARRAFLYSNGVMSNLGSLSSSGGYSDANDINELGEVVGSTTVGSQSWLHA